MPTASVLFVCLGNICRSPAAEAVFLNHLHNAGKADAFTADSAGTIAMHAGNPADRRMIAAAGKRGIDVTSISRPVRRADFSCFNLIVAMDESNREDLLDAGADPERVKLLGEFLPDYDEDIDTPQEVPDPYYGAGDGFETVLNMLEAAMPGVVDWLEVYV